MAASSSRDSEHESEAPPRRRRTTTRRASAAATEDRIDAQEAPAARKAAAEPEPFGFDPEEYLPPRAEEAPEPRRPRTRTRRTVVRVDDAPVEEAASEAPPPPAEPVERERPARAPRTRARRAAPPVEEQAPEPAPPPADFPPPQEFYHDDDQDGGDQAGPAGGGEFQEGGGGYQGGDYGDGYDRGPRRRRRRRRRPGPGGGSQPPTGYQGRGGESRGPGRFEQQGRPRRHQGGGGGGAPRRDFRERDRAPLPEGENQFAGDVQIQTLEGVLELHPKGYGFLRDPKNNYHPTKSDPFVSGTFVERCKLREGVMVRGEVIPGNRGQGPRLKSIELIDGRTIEDYQQIKSFDQLTAINPFEQIKLEIGPTPVTMRVMDLLTPIGKGQRALLVAPPRTGKTMLLQEIAESVSTNHPEIHLMVLLIDERPEEVTEMRRHVRGEVIASSLDRDVESHVRIAQLIVERGKRLAEEGQHVFILLDSITRTARAFNKWVNNSGRTGTGGLDIKALDIPKKLFGTARRFDEGGSLTIAGTALVETGSRMDDVIFEEFKGTGNMELQLSRQLADRRIWPAIDIQKSGTRREEKLLSPETLEGVTLLRRSLISLSPVEAMEQLTRTLAKFPSNKEFLAKIRQVL